MSTTHHTVRLQLWEYYALEGGSSFAATMFGSCVFFWTRARFGYTDVENLALGITQGLIYIVAARYGGRLADRIGCDRMMASMQLAMALLLSLGVLPDAHAVPFGVVALYYLFVAPYWPASESSVMHARSRLTTPVRVGLYNLVWSSCGAAGFLSGGLLFEWRPDAVLWVPACLHAGQWFWMWRRGRGAPDAARAGSSAMDVPHCGAERPAAVRRRFMRLAWAGNVMAYMMITAFVALTPQLGERLGLGPSRAIAVACGFLAARVAAFALFWRWEGWHYRARWSVAALWVAPACLAAAFFAPWPAAVGMALIGFGLAVGLSYSGSLYYSMNYGDATGEQGGLHEAVLGVGVLAGPLVGAVGSRLLGGVEAGQGTLVATVLVLAAAATAWLATATRRSRA